MQPAARNCKMVQAPWVPSLLLIATLISCASALYFPSLDSAVKGLPELSVLSSQIDTTAPTLAAQLRADGFTGTLFAPTNATLSPLLQFQNLMPATLLSDVLGMAVIPGPPMQLTDLVNGAVLTTLNGKTVTVTVKQAADGSGPIYYINKARITAGNIYAGGSVIHETFGLIVPAASQPAVNLILKDVTSPSASINLSPNGPPSPSPSPSPAAAVPSPSPSPTVVTPSPSPSPSVVVSPSPSPSTGTGTTSNSPSPVLVTSPSPSPVVGTSPSPPPSTVVSPAPVSNISPSPSPVVGQVSPSPSSPVASPSPAPTTASPTSSPSASPASPSPSPSTPSPSPAAPSGPSGSFWDFLNNWAGSDTVGSDPVGSDTTGSDPVGSDTKGSDTVGNGGSTTGSTVPANNGTTGSHSQTPVVSSPVYPESLDGAGLIVGSSPMVGSDSTNSTGRQFVIVPGYSAGSTAVAGAVAFAMPVMLGVLFL